MFVKETLYVDKKKKDCSHISGDEDIQLISSCCYLSVAVSFVISSHLSSFQVAAAPVSLLMQMNFLLMAHFLFVFRLTTIS